LEERIEQAGFNSIVGVMTLGTLRVLGIIESGREWRPLTRLSSETQQRLAEILRAIVKTLGLRHGPLFVELTAHREVAKVSAAIPAACAALLRFRIPLVDEDVSLEELLVRNALGMDIARVYPKC
jgi:hypothetical protein